MCHYFGASGRTRVVLTRKQTSCHDAAAQASAAWTRPQQSHSHEQLECVRQPLSSVHPIKVQSMQKQRLSTPIGLDGPPDIAQLGCHRPPLPKRASGHPPRRPTGAQIVVLLHRGGSRRSSHATHLQHRRTALTPCRPWPPTDGSGLGQVLLQGSPWLEEPTMPVHQEALLVSRRLLRMTGNHLVVAMHALKHHPGAQYTSHNLSGVGAHLWGGARLRMTCDEALH
jgi:hypothetical protein